MRTSRGYWLCQLLGWGGYSLVEAGVATKMLRLPLGRSSLELAVLAVLGIALTHMLRALVRRRAWARLPIRALAPRIFGMALLMSLPVAAITDQMSIAQLWGRSSIYIACTFRLEWFTRRTSSFWCSM